MTWDDWKQNLDHLCRAGVRRIWMRPDVMEALWMALYEHQPHPIAWGRAIAYRGQLVIEPRDASRTRDQAI